MTLRPVLWHYPAGPFFAISAITACVFPWIWILPGGDAHLLHLRLGIFGFGGAAVIGYVLTALPAWSPHRPFPATWVMVAAFLLARGLSVTFPAQIFPSFVLSVMIGVAILMPALHAGLSRLPIAAAPLSLALGEAMIVAGWIPYSWAVLFMAGLILLVGGKAVPAFVASDLARQERRPSPLPPLWLPFVLVLPVMLLPGLAAWAVGIMLAASIFWRSGLADRPDQATLLLGGAWSSLALTLPGLLLTGTELRQPIEHLFLIVTMGGTIFAFAGRAAMPRPFSGGLRPRPLQISGLALILLAGLLRGTAAFAPQWPWFFLSACSWSAGWLCFLAVHLPASWRPAPFPILSASRKPKEAEDGSYADEGAQRPDRRHPKTN
ncbi:NnrS family protein [Pontibaca methylaminivorans]|uniref:NnrS family protein n=1 Tax=Pontibaca methylaminivorans TaxID=515897 RepID=UPI002FDB6A4C